MIYGRKTDQTPSLWALCPPDFLTPVPSLIIFSNEMGTAPPGPRRTTAEEMLSLILFSRLLVPNQEDEKVLS